MWLGPKGAMWKKNGSKVRATTSRAVRGTQREKHTHSELSNALFLPGASRASSQSHTHLGGGLSISLDDDARADGRPVWAERTGGKSLKFLCSLLLLHCACCNAPPRTLRRNIATLGAPSRRPCFRQDHAHWQKLHALDAQRCISPLLRAGGERAATLELEGGLHLGESQEKRFRGHRHAG